MCAVAPRTRAALGMLLAVCGGAAFAADDLVERATAAAASEASTTVGGAGSATFGTDAPRLTRTDLPAVVDRGLPGQRAEFSELSYRWWVSRGRTDVGFGLGTLVKLSRPDGTLPGMLPIDAATTQHGAQPTVLTLGMRYRTSERSALYADAVNVYGLKPQGSDLVGKVGIEFKGAQSRFNIAYGGLGLRLAGDTKMTLRIRKGGLMVALRRAF